MKHIMAAGAAYREVSAGQGNTPDSLRLLYKNLLLFCETSTVSPVSREIFKLVSVDGDQHQHGIGHHEPPEELQQTPPQRIVHLGNTNKSVITRNWHLIWNICEQITTKIWTKTKWKILMFHKTTDLDCGPQWHFCRLVSTWYRQRQIRNSSM